MQASLKRSIWVWSKALVNVPKTDPTLRFLLFEIDTKDLKILDRVLIIYRKYNLSVYYHETANGWHFISLTPMSRDDHQKAIREIKHLNPRCPLIALRIKTNKWDNELEFWRNGFIENNQCAFGSENLLEFKQWLERQALGLIMKNYNVVRYPLEECPKCKKSNKIRYDYNTKKFICIDCAIECSPRGQR